jgi:adenosine deaminase
MLDLNSDDLCNIQEFALEFHSTELKNKFLEKVIEWGFKIKVIASFARTPDSLGVLFCTK